MDTIDRQIHHIILQDYKQYARQKLAWLDKTLLTTKWIPSEVISGLLLIGCAYFYLSHGLKISTQDAVICICLLMTGSLLALLSLYVEKSSLSKIQALVSFFGSFFLLSQLHMPG